MAPRKKDKALTAKEEMFCYEYVKDLNAQAAARRAGYACTPSKTYAELLKRDNIKKLVDRLIKERKAACKMDADQVLQELMALAKSDITQYLTIEQQELVRIKKSPNGKEKPKEIKVLEDVVVFRDLNKVDTRPIQSVRKNKDGISFKLNDKVKALEMLGRHFGLWKEETKGMVGEAGQLLITAMNQVLEESHKQSGKQTDA